MGQILFFGIALLLVVQIFRQPGIKKLPWFFAGIMFFPLTVNIWPSPPISIPRLAVYSLFASTFFLHKDWYKEYKAFPLKSATFFLFIMLLLIGIFNPVDLFSRFFVPIDLFIKNFLVVFLVYYHIKSVEDAKYMFKVILNFFIVFCIYGLSIFITKENQYYTLISNTFGSIDIPNYFMGYLGRFRISSFAWHPIYYGFLLSIGIFLNIYFTFLQGDNKRMKWYNLILFLLLFSNLLLTNSRTPMIAFLGGAGILFLFGLNWRLKLQILIFGGIMGVATLATIPSASDLIVESINTFSDDGSEMEGSSLDMRITQMNASLNEFNKSPILGNGYGYIGRGLGYSADKSKSSSDEDFAGFESYSYKLLIEQGLAGMLGNLVFFISLFSFFYKKSKKEDVEKISLLTISMLIVFLIFIFGTGDMGTFIICMSVIGINVKLACLLNEQRIANNPEANTNQKRDVSIMSIT